MTATGIPMRHLHLAWPDLWPLLQPAVKRTPEKPDVLARLIAGDAQLWAIYEAGSPVAAVVTQITLQPAKRLRLWLVGGARLKEWAPDFMKKAESYARRMDCIAIWGAGRDGWARIVRTFGGTPVDSVDGLLAWERRL